MPMALLPEVVMLPNDVIAMAPSVVPSVPMLPALMPAAKVPLVVAGRGDGYGSVDAARGNAEGIVAAGLKCTRRFACCWSAPAEVDKVRLLI
jgi:hypothetical protein